MLNCSQHFILEEFNHIVLANLVILVTNIGGDGESWRNRYSDKVHLSKVSTLATQKVSHVCLTLGLTIAEEIDALFVFCHNLELKQVSYRK